MEPLPIPQILSLLSENRHIVIMEETAGNCGIGESLACGIYENCPASRVERFDLGHRYITHGSVKQLYEHYHLDGRSVAEHILEVQSNEN